jgi:hypothetical protein
MAGAEAFGRDPVFRSESEPALALLIRAYGTQKVYLTERWPVDVCEVEFAVHALPKQETRKTDLATRTYD